MPDALRAACANMGIVYRDLPADGRWHTTDINGDPRGRGDGRIKLFSDGEGGIVCNWKSGESLPFFADNGYSLTGAERTERELKRQTRIREVREKEDRCHAAARDRAQALWSAAPRVFWHPYLRRKRVRSHGLRQYHGDLVIAGMPCDGALIVPARDTGGAIHTLEFIHTDKRFLPGGDYRARYFAIGTPGDTLCIVEGYASGATVHEATGHAVAVAFSAGNLTPVARALRAKYPAIKIILCADNDRFTPGNPGVTSAAEAARAVGGLIAVPRFPDLGPYDYYRGGAGQWLTELTSTTCAWER
ncbi:MAG: toprim domain-containing protein [Gammaproteobacteria bacterium]